MSWFKKKKQCCLGNHDLTRIGSVANLDDFKEGFNPGVQYDIHYGSRTPLVTLRGRCSVCKSVLEDYISLDAPGLSHSIIRELMWEIGRVKKELRDSEQANERWKASYNYQINEPFTKKPSDSKKKDKA